MPASYWVDHDHGVIHVLLHGTVTDDELRRLQDQVNHDFRAAAPNLHRLVDETAATEIHMSAETMDYIVRVSMLNKDVKRAIVTRPGLKVGYGRLFDELPAEERSKTREFTDVVEARRWLTEN